MVIYVVRKKIYSLYFACLAGALLLYPEQSFAQDNAGNVMVNINTNTTTIPTLISALSYITGIGFTIMGLIKMRDYVDNPSQNFMKDALARLGVGAFLILLPFAISVAANTVGADNAAAITRPRLYQ